MNHARNAARFAVFIFWLVMLGLAWTVANNAGNAHAMSWVTWLVYFVFAVVLVYSGVVMTKKLWSVK